MFKINFLRSILNVFLYCLVYKSSFRVKCQQLVALFRVIRLSSRETSMQLSARRFLLKAVCLALYNTSRETITVSMNGKGCLSKRFSNIKHELVDLEIQMYLVNSFSGLHYLSYQYKYTMTILEPPPSGDSLILI